MSLSNVASNPGEEIFRGMQELAEAVLSTYGPEGNTVIINNNGELKITKDGATVAKMVNSEDPITQIGIDLIKESCLNANILSGDGSTTTVALCFALIKNLREIQNLDIRQATQILNWYKDLCVENLKKGSNPINNAEDLISIAKVSTNGDEQLVKVLSEAFKHTLGNTRVLIQSGLSDGYSIERVQGFKLPIIPVSKYFSDKTGQSYRTEAKYKIHIIKNKVFSLEDLKPYLTDLNTPKLFIVHDIEEGAVQALLNNHLAGRIVCNVLKYPVINDYKRELLGDLEASLEEDLSECTILDDTLIVHTVKSAEDLQDRIDVLTSEIKKCPDLGIKEKLKDRKANLLGSVYRLYIGGETEAVVGERVDRAEDAVNAIHAALRAGYSIGGGLAFLDIIKELPKPELEVEEAIQKALNYPCELLRGDHSVEQWKQKVYARRVIDPTQVLINALEAAIALAKLFVSTRYCVVNNSMF